MKDLTKIYIDLSKCTEEQRKSLPQILEKAGEEIYSTEKQWLENGEFDEPHLYLCDNRIWITSYVPNLTEITYPEFIKLFEGGEETEVQKLKKQIGLYKECFELFIPTDKWDEANEFLSINNNPLEKHLSKVQRGVEKKPKF